MGVFREEVSGSHPLMSPLLLSKNRSKINVPQIPTSPDILFWLRLWFHLKPMEMLAGNRARENFIGKLLCCHGTELVLQKARHCTFRAKISQRHLYRKNFHFSPKKF